MVSFFPQCLRNYHFCISKNAKLNEILMLLQTHLWLSIYINCSHLLLHDTFITLGWSTKWKIKTLYRVSQNGAKQYRTWLTMLNQRKRFLQKYVLKCVVLGLFVCFTYKFITQLQLQDFRYRNKIWYVFQDFRYRISDTGVEFNINFVLF